MSEITTGLLQQTDSLVRVLHSIKGASSMKLDDFLKLDYLVFSSHKTMTQSIVHTLNRNGLYCVHMHRLENLELDEEKIRHFCHAYWKKNRRKLKIISVFRDPMERMMSSFFQSLSVERWGRTLLGSSVSLRGLSDEQAMVESVLSVEDFDIIQQRFWYYCAVIDGFGESIQELLRIFELQHDQITFQPSQVFTKNGFEHVNLYLSRFDFLKEEFQPALEHLTGTNLAPYLYNISGRKWYAIKYDEFRERVRVPNVFLVNMYESRKLLFERFYDNYDGLVAKRLERYSL